MHGPFSAASSFPASSADTPRGSAVHYTPGRSLLPSSREWLVVIDSGGPPWSGVWRPRILAETGCVNKNHFSYSLSLCCVIGQIRNVCGLKFRLSTWSSMWKDEPASWERHLSFEWMQAGTWKAGELSLGVKIELKKKKKKTFLKGRAQGEASFLGLGRCLQRQANAEKGICPENSLIHGMLAFLPWARGKALGVRSDMREIRGLFL